MENPEKKKKDDNKKFSEIIIVTSSVIFLLIISMFISPYADKYLSTILNGRSDIVMIIASSVAMALIMTFTLAIIKTISNMKISGFNHFLAIFGSAISVFMILTFSINFEDVFRGKMFVVIIFGVVMVFSTAIICFIIQIIKGKTEIDVGEKAFSSLIIPALYMFIIIAYSIGAITEGPENSLSGDLLSHKAVRDIKSGRNMSAFVDEMTIPDEEKELTKWIINNDLSSMKPKRAEISIITDGWSFRTPYGVLNCSHHGDDKFNYINAWFMPNDSDKVMKMSRFSNKVIDEACLKNRLVTSDISEWKIEF